MDVEKEKRKRGAQRPTKLSPLMRFGFAVLMFIGALLFMVRSQALVFSCFLFPGGFIVLAVLFMMVLFDGSKHHEDSEFTDQ